MEHIDYLIRAANGYRHEDYKRTVDLAETYNKLYTGENMESLMRKFDMRESKEMFEQRKRITQHITSTVMRNLAKPFNKIPRANNLQRVITYEGDEESKKSSEFEKLLSKFWGNKSVDKYISTRWIELNTIDPNSFIAIEWKNFNPAIEFASPYPFERKSKDVLDFYYNNEILEYVVVRSYLNAETENGEVQIERYTIYTKNYALIMTETLDEALIRMAKEELQVIGGVEIVKLENQERVFVIDRPIPYNLKRVPAIRVGYIRDMFTDGRICLSPLDEAVPPLMKMVKSNSELDLTMALHAHPQKIQYQNKCLGDSCHNGRLPDDSTCGVCGGTGLAVSTTTQDVLWLPLPKEGEPLIDLNNVVRYVYPPVDLIKNQQTYIERLTAYCKEAIYNTELFSRQEVAETATGKNIDLQNIYDALYPMAEAYSATWEFVVGTVAKILDKDEGLIHFFRFSKDFKMKSLNDLYNDLKLVSDSKADSFVKDGITDDIARIMYHDDVRNYYKWKTEKAFFPFSGKSPQEIALALASPLTPDNIKSLYYNYSWVLDVLAIENKGFWEMSYTKQYELIMDKIEEITPKIVEPTFREEDEQRSGVE